MTVDTLLNYSLNIESCFTSGECFYRLLDPVTIFGDMHIETRKLWLGGNILPNGLLTSLQ